jgi:hypothetical protein
MYKKIYVLCPGGIKTGGTELLHQLVFALNHIGNNAKIVYTGKNVGIQRAFEKYVYCYTYDLTSIDEDCENLLIVSETQIEYLNNYKNIKKAIWWLSVDNYIKNASFVARYKLYGLGSAVYRWVKGNIHDRRVEILAADIHFCQSIYAVKYLESDYDIGTNKIKYLSDYINDCYTTEYHGVIKNNRQNIVLYNPKKGYQFTKKLIKMTPDIQWIAIENMTNEEVRALLRKGKCYVDFGNHPGKDRFPREAAICGCIVITGRRGSAAYSEDVCIPEKFKFDEKRIKKSVIVDNIRMALQNYSDCIDEFDNYRQLILKEKDKFMADVKEIFTLDIS